MVPLRESKATIFAFEVVLVFTAGVTAAFGATVTNHLVSVVIITHIIFTSFVLTLSCIAIHLYLCILFFHDFAVEVLVRVPGDVTISVEREVLFIPRGICRGDELTASRHVFSLSRGEGKHHLTGTNLLTNAAALEASAFCHLAEDFIRANLKAVDDGRPARGFSHFYDTPFGDPMYFFHTPTTQGNPLSLLFVH